VSKVTLEKDHIADRSPPLSPITANARMRNDLQIFKQYVWNSKFGLNSC